MFATDSPRFLQGPTVGTSCIIRQHPDDLLCGHGKNQNVVTVPRCGSPKTATLYHLPDLVSTLRGYTQGSTMDTQFLAIAKN